MGELSKMIGLRSYLAQLPNGRIEDTDELEHLLFLFWVEFVGSNLGGMEPRKLIGRLESVEWNNPKLSFQIERHGAFVMGSVYAELHHWIIDIDGGVALLQDDRKRRLIGTRSAPLKVGPMAKEIATLIIEGKEDPRLKWKSPSEVRFFIGRVIPYGAVQQTLIGRRKRFWKALEGYLQGSGWKCVSTMGRLVRYTVGTGSRLQLSGKHLYGKEARSERSNAL